jgi:hypothetical protein
VACLKFRLLRFDVLVAKPVSGKFQATPDPLRSAHKVNRTAELIGD